MKEKTAGRSKGHFAATHRRLSARQAEETSAGATELVAFVRALARDLARADAREHRTIMDGNSGLTTHARIGCDQLDAASVDERELDQ